MKTAVTCTVLLVTGVLCAQAPVLLKDINATPTLARSSSPTAETRHYHDMARWNKIARWGDHFFFVAQGLHHGRELYTAKAYPGSVRFVKDIRPGFADAKIRWITPAGNKVYFEANDGVFGSEPWVSDGTAEGTRMVTNFDGAEDGWMVDPIGMDGFCYFCTRNRTTGYILVKSDGSQVGTSVMATFNAPWSDPCVTRVREGTQVVNRLFFEAPGPGAAGREPWVSDGTRDGTRMLKDIRPGSGDGGCCKPMPIAGKVLFWADDGEGPALWSSEGKPENTFRLGVPEGWGMTRGWDTTIAMGDKIMFRGPNSYAVEFWDPYHIPWVTDGTLAGTRPLLPDQSIRDFFFPATVLGKCIFADYTHLISTDGTAAGTKRIRQHYAYFPFPWASTGMESIGSKVLYAAEGGVWGSSLWVTDGTAGGTSPLRDYVQGLYWSSPESMTSYMGKAVFFGTTTNEGRELFVSNGTLVGTHLHTDILPGILTTAYADPEGMTLCNGYILFTADDGTGRRLWRTDGTTEGTIRLSDSLTPNQFKTSKVIADKLLLFSASDGVHGCEPWVSDGTVEGTRMLIDGRPGSASGFMRDPVMVRENSYYFMSTDRGSVLCRTDGQEAVQVGRPGGMTGWKNVITLGDRILFEAYSFGHGKELWSGNDALSEAGMVRDLLPGPDSGGFLHPCRFREVVFFFALTSEGRDLWRTNGLVEGTERVKSGVGNALPYPTVLGDRLVFQGDGGIWFSDGTTQGTVFSDVSRSFADPVIFRGKIYFNGTHRTTGRQGMWVTDGTKEGTKLFFDPESSYSANTFSHPIALPSGRLFFSMKTLARGTEGFVSDGTPTGTHLLWDGRPGPDSGYFNYPTSFGNGWAVVVIDDGQHGRELFLFR